MGKHCAFCEKEVMNPCETSPENCPYGRPISIAGYEGTDFDVNDRIELHPATDFWMRGARFGTVLKVASEWGGIILEVELDKLPGKVCRVPGQLAKKV